MTAGLTDSQERKSATHSSWIRASSQLVPISSAIACQYAATPGLPWSSPSRCAEYARQNFSASPSTSASRSITVRSAADWLSEMTSP